MAILWDSLVRPADLTTYLREVPVAQEYVLSTLLPDRTVMDTEVSVTDVTVTVNAAKYRAFDAPPAPGVRDAFTRRSVRIPAVSQMLTQGEMDRIRQDQARARGGSDSAIIDAIYDDATTNARAIRARVELARGDLLTDGKVTLAELGAGVEADFGVPGGHIVTAATLWSSTSAADPLADLRAWSDVYRATNGYRPGGMVISSQVAYYLLQNAAMRSLAATSGGAPSMLTREQVDAMLASYMLPPISMIYDAQVMVDGISTSVIPASRVILVPPSGVQLGETVWGLTVTGSSMQDQGVQVPGGPAGMVGVVDESSTPPYRRAMYADATCLPVLTSPRSLFVATVA